MSEKKILGNSISINRPGPDLMQTDPKKGSFVHGKEEFARQHIPTPATAEAGQFIVVSAVDENGGVTATQAVTLEDLSEVMF